ncbi:signal peptidase I [Jeotgalibacillus salarius]|uniref:Signal peptidase I n=1 Tax=Jeotgalibacillus salarius TaxID=546023 RepID=A0A4Y8LII5_9BACL|nr:signal peptidase I [Jeotgalibacillus salarius]TFE02738.1 signal peptidase I [Jeotgalibacillus salarius]
MEIRNEWWEWSKTLLAAVLIAAVIRLFLFSPVLVDGSSMVPTLQDGDRMIVNKFQYTYTMPERFDIVVFHVSEKEDYIKRVIGLPGETVAFKDDQLYINGEPVEESFRGTEAFTENFTLFELTGFDEVPENHLFVMGDNRQYSKDSRHIGPIPIDEVVGETPLIYWPFKDIKLFHKE